MCKSMKNPPSVVHNMMAINCASLMPLVADLFDIMSEFPGGCSKALDCSRTVVAVAGKLEVAGSVSLLLFIVKTLQKKMQVMAIKSGCRVQPIIYCIKSSGVFTLCFRAMIL